MFFLFGHCYFQQQKYSLDFPVFCIVQDTAVGILPGLYGVMDPLSYATHYSIYVKKFVMGVVVLYVFFVVT